jgi:hypothetical protein
MKADDLPAAAQAFLAEWGPPRLGPLRAFQADLAALLETVRAEAAPRWVRTAEEMPAEGVEVLTWREHSGARIAALCGGGWFDEDVFLYNVTHWMELPPGPPEEGETDG